MSRMTDSKSYVIDNLDLIDVEILPLNNGYKLLWIEGNQWRKAHEFCVENNKYKYCVRDHITKEEAVERWNKVVEREMAYERGNDG